MITCQFENGNDASLRHITVVALAYKENKILLVKRAPHLPRGGKYTVPGGFMDRDENLEQGVLRELREETGYEGGEPVLFRINDNPRRPKEDRQNVDFIFLVPIVSGEPRDNSEVTEIKWFDFENIPTEEEFAYDHRESILEMIEYLKEPQQLPIIG